MRAGVAIYKFLKYLSDEYKFRVDLVYMKYGDHSLLDSETENGQEALKELHAK